jgi:hypothetical protein
MMPPPDATRAGSSPQPNLFGESTSDDRGAELSACGTYRYTLWRVWGAGPIVNFVMLNPSTADATADDPTIRRCIDYARRWGFAELVVTNLFAYRATDPRELPKVADPVGPENDRHLLAQARAADRVVCAWGNNGKKASPRRAAEVCALLRSAGAVLHALKITGAGCPQHPLYLSAELVPEVWG